MSTQVTNHPPETTQLVVVEIGNGYYHVKHPFLKTRLIITFEELLTAYITKLQSKGIKNPLQSLVKLDPK